MSQGSSQPQDSSDSSKTKPDMWAQLELNFQQTMSAAQVAYKTNYLINLIIVAIGIILLGSSLLFAWTRGLNPDTLTFAGLGIADFVAIFLVNPQFRIQQLLGDLNQIQVIYRTWRDQLGLIDNYTGTPDNHYKDMTFAEIQAIDGELNKIGQDALLAIETYIGAKVPPAPSSTSSTVNSTQPKQTVQKAQTPAPGSKSSDTPGP